MTKKSRVVLAVAMNVSGRGAALFGDGRLLRAFSTEERPSPWESVEACVAEARTIRAWVGEGVVDVLVMEDRGRDGFLPFDLGVLCAVAYELHDVERATWPAAAFAYAADLLLSSEESTVPVPDGSAWAVDLGLRYLGRVSSRREAERIAKDAVERREIEELRRKTNELLTKYGLDDDDA